MLRTKLPNAVPGHTYGIELQTVFGCSILCGGLKGDPAPACRRRHPSFGAPTVVTQDATNISDNAAKLNSRGRSVGGAVSFTPREVVETGARGKPGAGAPTGRRALRPRRTLWVPPAHRAQARWPV